jgi:hypothetical protein
LWICQGVLKLFSRKFSWGKSTSVCEFTNPPLDIIIISQTLWFVKYFFKNN